MLWDTHVALTINGNNILVEGKGDFGVLCIGSTVDILRGNSGRSSFLATISGERNELLAVHVNKHPRHYFHFIHVQGGGGVLRVNENRNWIPYGDRLGIINSNGHIKIKTRGKVFSTDPKASDGAFFVGDANACCKYLSGQIDLEELMAAAEETQKQIDLQQRCEDLDANNSNLHQDIELLLANESRWRKEKSRLIEAHEAECKALREEIARQVHISTQLRDAVKSPIVSRVFDGDDGFFRGYHRLVLRKSLIKEALKLFPDNRDGSDDPFYPDARM